MKTSAPFWGLLGENVRIKLLDLIQVTISQKKKNPKQYI